MPTKTSSGGTAPAEGAGQAEAAHLPPEKHVANDAGDCVSWCPACAVIVRAQQAPLASNPKITYSEASDRFYYDWNGVIRPATEREIAGAMERLAAFEHEHEALLRGRIPTHRCKVCGALWILWPAGTGGMAEASWSLFSLRCGQCCDCAPMGEQIEPLPRLGGSAPETTAPLAQMSAAAADVIAERLRQLTKEGWSPEHDDQHADGQLAEAAACYALSGAGNLRSTFERWWPWSFAWWKPKGERRDLVRAGALILAEIERLDRASKKAGALPAEVPADHRRGTEPLSRVIADLEMAVSPDLSRSVADRFGLVEKVLRQLKSAENGSAS